MMQSFNCRKVFRLSRESKLRRQLARQSQQSGNFQITAQNIHYSGPLPHPDILIKYNDAHPGAADRIIAMAEKQSAHRQAIEKSVIDSNCHVQKTGPIYGLIICVSAIAAGTYLIHSGQQAGGLAAIISALTGLTVVFIYGKRKQKQDLANKIEPITTRS